MEDDWDWTKPKELTIENLEEAVRLMRDMIARDDIIACDREIMGMNEWGFIVTDPKPNKEGWVNENIICRQCGFAPANRVIIQGGSKVICDKCGMVLRSDL